MLRTNMEVEMVVCDWLRMQEPEFYGKRFKLVPRWGNVLLCLGTMMNNNDISVE
jgi:hypothetical protein